MWEVDWRFVKWWRFALAWHQHRVQCLLIREFFMERYSRTLYEGLVLRGVNYRRFLGNKIKEWRRRWPKDGVFWPTDNFLTKGEIWTPVPTALELWLQIPVETCGWIVIPQVKLFDTIVILNMDNIEYWHAKFNTQARNNRRDVESVWKYLNNKLLSLSGPSGEDGDLAGVITWDLKYGNWWEGQGDLGLILEDAHSTVGRSQPPSILQVEKIIVIGIMQLNLYR